MFQRYGHPARSRECVASQKDIWMLVTVASHLFRTSHMVCIAMEIGNTFAVDSIQGLEWNSGCSLIVHLLREERLFMPVHRTFVRIL